MLLNHAWQRLMKKKKKKKKKEMVVTHKNWAFLFKKWSSRTVSSTAC